MGSSFAEGQSPKWRWSFSSDNHRQKKK